MEILDHCAAAGCTIALSEEPPGRYRSVMLVTQVMLGVNIVLFSSAASALREQLLR